MKFTERLEAVRLRAGAWARERKERAEEKKAQKQAARVHDPHAHSRFWLLNVPALATICAAITEWYWAVLFCLAATGRLTVDWATSAGSGVATTGAWHFALNIENIAVLVGLIFATIPIVMLSMVWLPVQFVMRGAGRFRRGTLITVGILANVLVIVSGTVVMNYNRQGQVREALVTEQSADANRAMLAANVEGLQHELDTLMNHRSTYVATAASVGLAAYQRDYASDAAIAAERDPARRGLLTRARGAAARADDLRRQIAAARGAVARAAPVAATQANVEDRVGVGLNTFAQYVEVYRPPFVAFICTLIGIFGAWWTLAMLEHLNPRDVLRSGWAPEGQRIEDLRGLDIVDSQGRVKAKEPMTPPREEIYDAETGDRLVRVRQTEKEYLRRQPKGKKQKLEVKPDPEPDETGVPPEKDGRDSELREAASDAAHGENAPNDAAAQSQVGDDRSEAEPPIDAAQSEPPEETYTATDLDIIAPELAVEPAHEEPERQESAEPDQEPAEAVNEGEEVAQDEPQPETRQDRMLPSPESVAAE